MTRQNLNLVDFSVIYKGQTRDERFFSRVNKLGDEDCWEWLGRKDKDGYGIFTIGHKTEYPAHRVSWVLYGNRIADDMQILHKCDNPSCVNPAHLFIGTQLDNIRDMQNKNRNVNPPIHRGIENGNVKLTEFTVAKIKYFLNKKVYTEEQLAKIYGVAKSTISAISTNRTWKYVE